MRYCRLNHNYIKNKKNNARARQYGKDISLKGDYERKEANESGYGVAGYFFYNKSDRSKFIFLPISTWSGELAYWTSEICEFTSANTFSSNGQVGCTGWIAGIESTGFAIRPVFVE